MASSAQTRAKPGAERSPSRRRAGHARPEDEPRTRKAASRSPAPPTAGPAKGQPGKRRAAKPRRSGRRDRRLTINKEFESFDAFVSEYVSNVSRSGVFVRTRKPLPVGTKVDLRFTILMEEVEVVEGVGEVVRVHDEPSGMGLVFTELSGYSEAVIERLLTARRLGVGADR